VAYIRYRSQTVAIEVCFPFNFAVIFDFSHFRFRPSKAKSIGNVLTNRQSAALRFMVFFSFYNGHCLLTHRIAFLGNARLTEKKPAKYYLEIKDAAKFNRIGQWRNVHRCVSILALTIMFPFKYFQGAYFCLFVRALPIDFALLGRKRKYIKSKTTAKLREKRTSIAAVRDILGKFGTFPTLSFSLPTTYNIT
jgi:hypothetical protein